MGDDRQPRRLHVDPISKTPEYKFGAVRLEPIADQAWAENYVQQEYSTLKGTLSKAGSKTPACA